MGILKRLYWLIPAFVTDPFDVLERLGVRMNIPPVVSWTLVVLGFMVAVTLTYHELRMESIRVQSALAEARATTMTLRPKRRLGFYHRMALNHMQGRMESVHGHCDYESMQAEMLDGVPISSVMKGECTMCGRLRNQLGGDNYD